ncbi:AI-2E family transporter [Patescibacteria group bacterium]|nr:AI-2E family transporter [Patescibacteria group bacterium]
MSLGWPGIIAILCVYAVTQWTENNILTPIVMNRTLGVSPLVVFLCMLL